jgi:hypothetical protein
MKITKRHLRRLFREASGSTKKYDDDSALTGGQSKLPDGLQKGIIDKTVEDREEEEGKEANEVRSIRKYIRLKLIEAIDIVNTKTGEVIDFGEDSLSGIPDAAVPDLARRLGIDLSQGELSHEDWTKLDDEVGGKQADRVVRKRVKKFKEDEARLDPDHLLSRLQNWAHIAFQDYAADNPGTDIQDVAFDLADAARYEFEQDEWDELLWHFDDDEDALKVYTAESMG